MSSAFQQLLFLLSLLEVWPACTFRRLAGRRYLYPFLRLPTAPTHSGARLWKFRAATQLRHEKNCALVALNHYSHAAARHKPWLPILGWSSPIVGRLGLPRSNRPLQAPPSGTSYMSFVGPMEQLTHAQKILSHKCHRVDARRSGLELFPTSSLADAPRSRWFSSRDPLVKHI